MGKRSRKSKRRVNSLFMMLLLTTVLMVASTYAWFSANREVSITGITAKVAAAEGLQISLDGKKWSSTVSVSEAILAALETVTIGEGNEAQTLKVNNYTWADELEPVSTDGTITGNDVNFEYGDVSADGATLFEIANSAANGGKYIVFDIYLKNSSSNDGGDNLQLSTGSSVTINTTEGGKANTGLENCVRAGVLLYSSTSQFTAAQSDIIQMTAGSTPRFAIWEPNYTAHIGEVVENDGRISAANDQWDTRALKPNTVGKNIRQINTSATSIYECNSDGVVADGATATAFLDIPNTVTSATGSVTEIKYLTSTADGTTKLNLAKNSIHKARVYIWLEGQDPDCNDTASTGRAFDISINLRKPTKAELATPTPSPAQQGG